jgi:hypothetical protein
MVDERKLAHVTMRELEAMLADPIGVHLNMLRGSIAKPSPVNIWHLYGRALLDAMPAEYRAALTNPQDEGSPRDGG